MRRLMLPLTALILAAATTFSVRTWLDTQRAAPARQAEAPAPAASKAVLVAAVDLPTGSFIQPESLRWQDWPDVTTPDTYYIRAGDQELDLVGAVLRRPLAAGEPVASGNLVKPGDRGFLAAVLDPGMRAVSVPVDEVSGNAGLIFPGDRVDLILTQTLEPATPGAEARRVSETVLEDVRAIAMGRRLKTEAGEDSATGAQVRTVTLETTPAGAEKVALVTELGKLSLSLRSLASADAATQGRRPADLRLTWDTDVSPALRLEHEPGSGLSVIRGEKIETITTRQGAGS